MKVKQEIITDNFNRVHNYLRISITERCNLRCTYCMPVEGIPLSPKSEIMSTEEVYALAKKFVEYGVTKIRLTGGEPLIRKDAREVMAKLASLPIKLAITTNAVIVDQFIDFFKEHGINDINVSLDSLSKEKNDSITRRNYFDKTIKNINLLIDNGFNVKMNVVLMKGFNEDEIGDFIELTKQRDFSIRFIEFMPFDGNKWQLDKIVSLKEIVEKASKIFGVDNIIRIEDAKNDTAKNYQVKGFKGEFAIISSVTNPFCDSCNRLRLTANGRLKNCLFSDSESDLLTSFRAGKSIDKIVQMSVQKKKKIRNGMESLSQFQTSDTHTKNRSMTTIGG